MGGCFSNIRSWYCAMYWSHTLRSSRQLLLLYPAYLSSKYTGCHRPCYAASTTNQVSSPFVCLSWAFDCMHVEDISLTTLKEFSLCMTNVDLDDERLVTPRKVFEFEMEYCQMFARAYIRICRCPRNRIWDDFHTCSNSPPSKWKPFLIFLFS